VKWARQALSNSFCFSSTIDFNSFTRSQRWKGKHEHRKTRCREGPNHNRLMDQLREKIRDRKVLGLIRRYLQAGVVLALTGQSRRADWASGQWKWLWFL
jgi:hypothetical protein